MAQALLVQYGRSAVGGVLLADAAEVDLHVDGQQQHRPLPAHALPADAREQARELPRPGRAPLRSRRSRHPLGEEAEGAPDAEAVPFGGLQGGGGGLSLGTIPAGQHKAVWLRRTIAEQQL